MLWPCGARRRGLTKTEGEIYVTRSRPEPEPKRSPRCEHYVPPAVGATAPETGKGSTERKARRPSKGVCNVHSQVSPIWLRGRRGRQRTRPTPARKQKRPGAGGSTVTDVIPGRLAEEGGACIASSLKGSADEPGRRRPEKTSVQGAAPRTGTTEGYSSNGVAVTLAFAGLSRRRGLKPKTRQERPRRKRKIIKSNSLVGRPGR